MSRERLAATAPPPSLAPSGSRRENGRVTMPYSARIAPLALALALAAPVSAGAQQDTSVVAGAHYAAGGLWRLFFGSEYRRLWAEPVTVPVLNLRTYAGGLRPTTAGRGMQTKSLRFNGADGFRYGFRSVDKDPDVPDELEGTFISDLIRDQISSQHPGGPPVAAALLTAAGVLHTDPMLVVLPDDAALDSFRGRFAGTLGYLERRATVQAGRPGFAGALEIVDTDSLLPRVFRSPANSVDARAFLAARLMDVLMGDWDRHRGQWTWARFGEGSPVVWEPIPEDRDFAFVRFDGPMLSMARHSALPQMVEFGEHWPYMAGQTWNGRDIDRWFLNGLERPVWDSVSAALQQRLSDSAIAASAHRLPESWYALDGERLARALEWRRDHLSEATHRFYRLLAREAELHATRGAELVTIDRLDDGRLAVAIAAREPAGAEPYLSRTFDPRDTREVRVYLYGGGDRVVVRGDGPGGITVRIIGGGVTDAPDSLLAGEIEVLDSSRAGGVRLYATGGYRALGPGRVRVDRRAYAPRQKRDDIPPPRDWGSRAIPTTWVTFGPDVGVFAGTGGIYTRYGFRKLPYASTWRWRAGWASTAATYRVATDATFYRTNSSLHADVAALASGIEVLRWHGLGNETIRSRPDAYYRVTQRRYALRASLVVPAAPHVELALGPVVTFNDTKARAGRIIADSMPYGTGDFGQVGLRGELRLDTRDLPGEPTRGVALTLGGSAVPAVWDVATTFGEVHGEAATYLTARAPLRTTLALRAGAKRVLGTYPFSEAAFIGDAATVRLGRQNRYGGDMAAWGNAELRVRLGRVFVLVPSDLGVFALGDAGRVWVEGESSDRWHTAAGGGVWLTLVRPGNVLSLTVARSPERTALYLAAGFAY